MATSTCNVCCEANAVVGCGSCTFQTCVSCAQRYLLESTRDTADCMSCHAVWNREKLLEAFPKKWVTKDWKERREDLLFERERGMMPATQLYITWLETKAVLREELRKVVAEKKVFKEHEDRKGSWSEDDHRLYKQLQDRHQTLTQQLHHNYFRDSTPAAKQPQLLCPCPAGGCKGFVLKDKKLECGTCKAAVCRECHELVSDSLVHTCKPESVLTAKQLAKESKPCPHCAAPTFRISGCAQMWCVMCHKPWNWNTGLSEEGQNIHNPHYFEWQRNNSGVQDRINFHAYQWRTDPAAFPPLNEQLSRNKAAGRSAEARRVKVQIDQELTNLNRRVTHLWLWERSKLTNQRFEENMDLRVKLMRGEVTDVQFKRVLQQREKKRIKYADYAGVLTSYCMRIRTLLRDMVLKGEEVPPVLEATTQVWKESHRHLERVAAQYDAVVPKYFTEEFWEELDRVRRQRGY